MQRVALVYPYFRTHSAMELLFPPLGVASLAAQLRRLGVEARIFDCTFCMVEQIEDDLRSYSPSIVGIYSMVTLSRNAFRLAEFARACLPDVTLIAGGPLPTVYPEQYSDAFDAIFRGEVDLSFPRFCRDLLYAKATGATVESLSLASYEGLYMRRDGLEVSNSTMHFPEKELMTFPLPRRDEFDHSAYQDAWLELDGTKTTSIMTTLGCPFSCDFCSRPIFGNLFRRRQLPVVFEEIAQVRSLGYDGLWIADDNFTLDVRYVEEFCAGVEGTGIRWSCLSRVSHITPDLAELMRSAGCRRVYLGLETGDAATLKLMKKQATVEEGEAAVRTFHRAGLEVAAFFIVGYPGETQDSVEKTLKFALDLPLEYVSFNVPFPLPGSPLFERVHAVDPGKDWNTENETSFVYESEFDAAWLRRRIGETLHEFAERRRRPG